MGLQSEKRALRQRMHALRNAVSPADSLRAGDAAAELISGTAEFAAASVIALYAALPGEVDTGPLLSKASSLGKRVCVPRACDPPQLEFVEFSHWDELQPGVFGVLEPIAGASALDLVETDLVIVPGVAFTAEGRRLGRGAGYYDRTFPRAWHASPRLFGLAFSFQVLAELPSDCHDRLMDAVCTEQALLRTLRPRGAA